MKLSARHHLKPLPFSLQYLSGQVSGQIVTDTVRIAQFEIYSQTFGMLFLFTLVLALTSRRSALANSVQNMSFNQLGISGMLGLSFPSIASIPMSRGLPVIFNIAYYLNPQSQFFAFRLGRDVGGNSSTSTFNIGAI